MVEQKVRNIGIEAKKPEDFCSDAKCPWHGTLPVRGMVLQGVVESNKAAKTVIVRWDYHNYMKKYERYERRKGTIRLASMQRRATLSGLQNAGLFQRLKSSW